MERKRDTGERMDALVKGADWAQMGTNGTEAVDPVAVAANKPRRSGAFLSCGAGIRTPTS